MYISSISWFIIISIRINPNQFFFLLCTVYVVFLLNCSVIITVYTIVTTLEICLTITLSCIMIIYENISWYVVFSSPKIVGLQSIRWPLVDILQIVFLKYLTFSVLILSDHFSICAVVRPRYAWNKPFTQHVIWPCVKAKVSFSYS